MHGFEQHPLDVDFSVWSTALPADLMPDASAFEALWQMHPDEHAEVRIMGRMVPIPRWQQAYGRDYAFAGGTSVARPIPSAFAPFLTWAQQHVDARLNGLLVNWYDAREKHYIGKHRDAPNGLVPDAPILTLSLGADRTLRMRPWRGRGMIDLPADAGSVYAIPARTNRSWTHEIPHFARDAGRRISVTIRAFVD
jgi:alkylated DNA repair dioxygenase AlkB